MKTNDTSRANLRDETVKYVQNIVVTSKTPKTPLEVIPYERAKTIESELKKVYQKLKLMNLKKGKIRNIVNSCFQQLDQNEILSGHIRGIIKRFLFQHC